MRAIYLRASQLSIVTFFSLLLVTGCTTQFSPAYDQAVLDNLNASNKDIQTLFAKIGTGVSMDTFKERKDAYDHIIGELNALVIQIKARPSPSGAIHITDVNKMLSGLGVSQVASDPNITEVPSARSVRDEADSIEKMKSHDEKYGLGGGALSSYKTSANAYMTQAITYETFLKR